MGYFVGIDEAGYAPNLGPLVIAATLWRVPGSPRKCGDLYDRLSSIICREVPKRRKTLAAPHDSAGDREHEPSPLPIADSKLLYNPQLGLATLEHGVLCMLRSAGLRPRDWRTLWEAVTPESLAQRDAVPWHNGFNPRLPLVANRKQLRAHVPALKSGLRQAGVRLLAVQATAIFPDQLNAAVRRFGSKGSALSHATIELLARTLQQCKKSPVLVVGDKHGGRNFYGRFLQEQFPDYLVEVRGESERISNYRFGPRERRVEVQFRVRGEEVLPVALASMVAKYFRELCMRAFNDFWCTRVPGLKATAGYPRDALRFKRQIEAVQAQLGIDDLQLWRIR
jgi:ribonuclease HII